MIRPVTSCFIALSAMLLAGCQSAQQVSTGAAMDGNWVDRKSTRLNSSHANISYAVFCLKKKNLLYLRLENDFPPHHRPFLPPSPWCSAVLGTDAGAGLASPPGNTTFCPFSLGS